MAWYLKPDAIQQARNLTGCKSDERLGAEMDLSAATIRSLRKGNTSPSVTTLMKFQIVTGKPMEALIYERADAAAA